jgi:hypothetical protein
MPDAKKSAEKRSFETDVYSAGGLKLQPRPSRVVDRTGDEQLSDEQPAASLQTSRSMQKGFVLPREAILRIIDILKEV